MTTIDELAQFHNTDRFYQNRNGTVGFRQGGRSTIIHWYRWHEDTKSYHCCGPTAIAGRARLRAVVAEREAA